MRLRPALNGEPPPAACRGTAPGRGGARVAAGPPLGRRCTSRMPSDRRGSCVTKSCVTKRASSPPPSPPLTGSASLYLANLTLRLQDTVAQRALASPHFEISLGQFSSNRYVLSNSSTFYHPTGMGNGSWRVPVLSVGIQRALGHHVIRMPVRLEPILIF